MRRRTARFDLLSTRPFGCSKGCWRTSAPAVAPPNQRPRGGGRRNIFSSGSYSDVRAPAKLSTQRGCTSRFQPAGIMTCCVASTIFAPPATRQTRASMKRSSYFDQSNNLMAGGYWRIPTPAQSISRSKQAMVTQVGGIRSARSGSSVGTGNDPCSQKARIAGQFSPLSELTFGELARRVNQRQLGFLPLAF